MPEALERELEGQADRKGLTGKRRRAYIYGTMRKTGWRPSREKGKHTAEDAANALARRTGRS